MLAEDSQTITVDNIVYTVDTATKTCRLTDGSKAKNTVYIPQCVSGYKVTSIADGAFRNNHQLISISLPPELTSMGESVFYNCSQLFDVCFSKGLTAVPASTFEDCEQLETIYIPEGVEELKESAFKGCSVLRTIELPYSIKGIGDRALADVGTGLEEGCELSIGAFTAPTLTSTSTEGAKFKRIYVADDSWYEYPTAQYWSQYSPDLFSTLPEEHIEIQSGFMGYTYGICDCSVPMPFTITVDGVGLYWMRDSSDENCVNQNYLRMVSSDPSCVYAITDMIMEPQLIVAGPGYATITVDYKGTCQEFQVVVEDTRVSLSPDAAIRVREGQTKTYTASLDGFLMPYDPEDDTNMGQTSCWWTFEIEKSADAEGQTPITILNRGNNTVDITGVRKYASTSGEYKLKATATYIKNSSSGGTYYYINTSNSFPITVTAAPKPTGKLSLVLPSGLVHFPDAATREIPVQIEAENGWKINTVMLGDSDITNLLDSNGCYTVPVLTDSKNLTAVFEQDNTTSEGDIDINVEDVKVFVNGRHITITGMQEGYDVLLFDLSGNCVYTTNEYDFEADGTGVRILRVGDHTFKFILR